MREDKKKLVQKILEGLKEIEETDFRQYEKPWDDTELTQARLISYDGVLAEIETTQGIKKSVLIMMSTDKLADFKELARHNDTVFLKNDSVVDWSCLSIWNGTLTPIDGGVVYE